MRVLGFWAGGFEGLGVSSLGAGDQEHILRLAEGTYDSHLYEGSMKALFGGEAFNP